MHASKHILLLAVILMICCNCNSRSDKLNKTTQEPSVIDVNQIKTDAASEDYELYPDALKVIGFMEYDPDYEFIILDALTDEDLHRQIPAINTVWTIGPDAFYAFPQLKIFMEEDNSVLKMNALRCVSHIAESDPAFDLYDLGLEDDNYGVRITAIRQMSLDPARAEERLDVLKEIALNDPYIDEETGEYGIRYLASSLIDRIADHLLQEEDSVPREKPVAWERGWMNDLSKVLEKLESGHEEERAAAATGLRYYNYRENILDLLIRALEDDSSWVRIEAINTIGSFGANAEKALEKLAYIRENDPYWSENYGFEKYGIGSSGSYYVRMYAGLAIEKIQRGLDESI